MMTNRQIARIFQLLAKMMELHGENEFRTRAYRNAYDVLKKMEMPVAELPLADLDRIKGIGKSTGEKIRELVETGKMQRFEQYAAKTPEGIRELLLIKGLGAGKVKAIWKGLGIESPGELLYACNENRLVELSGFGMKTQAEITKQLEYHLDASGKYLWAVLEPVAEALRELLMHVLPGRFDWVGEYARKSAIVTTLEGLTEATPDLPSLLQEVKIHAELTDGRYSCHWQEVYAFTIHVTEGENFDQQRVLRIGDADFLEATRNTGSFPIELQHMPPEIMEGRDALQRFLSDGSAGLIVEEDLIGILHCHSTYSDGLHTLGEMAEYVRERGYAYFGITDHSQSAVYARGLSPERVEQQWEEIEALNRSLSPFRVFRGIESDILSDGRLDYQEDLLKRFDFIVASVHAGLNMDEEKATARLISAIENPYTTILGHPTGRLLLARQGYPIDHRKVIDACARNGVAIELNANPQRLDMDHTWIPYALEQGVMIAINPDAHSRESIQNVRFGIIAARKGWLPKEACLNALSAAGFAAWLKQR